MPTPASRKSIPEVPAFAKVRHAIKTAIIREVDGGRGRNRTFNLSIKSRMLCQLSYASTEAQPGGQPRETSKIPPHLTQYSTAEMHP
jgi:hypothetical protein